ncbi:MAG: hypothetical protein PHR28_01605 [candidate division Zixibacteria bacterium]|nr:hypothetical protein [candidate division Zixibacteria bacterium]
MILRVTQKLARKIKVAPASCLDPDPEPYGDWTANLFVAARRQYIIISNTRSLFTVLTFGREITDKDEFINRFLMVLELFLTRQRLEPIYFGRIAPASETIVFSKTGDKRVLGSMNDLVIEARTAIAYRGRSLFDAAAGMNDMPMGMLKYHFPRKEFLALLEDDHIAGLV